MLKDNFMRGRYAQVELYPQAEFTRRWDIARSVMNEANVDVMLVVDAARESYDTWFSGRKMIDTVIIPKENDIIAVLHREYDESCFAADLEGVDYRRYTKQKAPDFEREGLRFINHPGQKGLAELLKKLGAKKIGLVNKRLLTKALKDAVTGLIPGAEFIDVKQALDSKKTIKSAYELESLRYASTAHEQLMEALKFIVRPGKKLSQINSEARKYLMGLGAYGDMHAFIVPLGKQDQPSLPPGHGPADPETEYGDRFMMIYESNSYGGHHIAMGRHLSVGPGLEDYKKSLRYAAELNQFAASMMKPGAKLGDIRRATEAKAIADGTFLTRMCWMHGLATDGYFEQFALNDYGMEWPLTEGAVLHCHPVHMRKLGNALEEIMLINTYLVTPEGGKSLVDLSKRPFDLIEIDC